VCDCVCVCEYPAGKDTHNDAAKCQNCATIAAEVVVGDGVTVRVGPGVVVVVGVEVKAVSVSVFVAGSVACAWWWTSLPPLSPNDRNK